jgi:hypothetical protein
VILQESYETTNSVEIFDGKSWRDVLQPGIPDMGRFVTLVVPYNITYACACVPDPVTDKCYYIDERKD